MKIMSVALLLMASMAFVLLGCSDNSSSLLTPKEQPTAAGSKSGKRRACRACRDRKHASLSGRRTKIAYVRLYGPENTRIEVADGEYQIYRHASGAWTRWHGKVIHLNVEGDKALIIGVRGPPDGSGSRIL